MSNELTNIGGINVSCDITKEDIIAIAVSNHEQELLTRKEQLTSKINDLKEDQKKLLKVRDKCANEIAKTRFEKPMKVILANLKALGFTSAVFSIEPSVKEISGEEIISVDIKINTDGDYYHRTPFVRTERIPPDDKMTYVMDKLNILSEQLEDECLKVIKIRKELSKISTMERRARATLTMNVLQKSEEGRSLLANLETQKFLTS